MRTALPAKKLIILDKDNCELDTLEIFYLHKEVLEQIARDRKIDVSELHRLTKIAPDGEHQFNDVVGLVDYLNKHDIFKSGNKGHTLSDARAVNEWIKRSAELTVFFPGVLSTLKKWHEAGTSVATQTDCERLSLVRRVWEKGNNACRQGELISPYQMISLYDRIYCKPSANEPEDINSPEFSSFLESFCNAYKIEKDFAVELTRHTTVFDDQHWKPHQPHIDRILSDFGVTPEEAVYLGDSHKDGREAMLRNVDFAWAEYGADWRREVAEFYPLIADSSWSYGKEAVLAAFKHFNVPVHAVMTNSMADIENFYNFIANEAHLRRPINHSAIRENQIGHNSLHFYP